MADLEEIRNISIIDYLNGIGIEVRKEGNRHFASSPFSSDRNWSFCIYPTNTYFDWSTGTGGDIITLHSRIARITYWAAATELGRGIAYEKYKPNYKKIKEDPEFYKEFKIERYITRRADERHAIQVYAASRGITSGYECGVFFSRGKGTEKWIRNPSMMFIHVDKNMNQCGAKFRRIRQQPNSTDQSARFSARGKIGVYVVDLCTPVGLVQEMVYVVEGEANANSLAEHLMKLGRKACVLSFGGVTSPLDAFPNHLTGLPIKLIIDYDGSEKLYQERIRLYKDIKAEPIKLILPKGEDINSLYVKNEMYLIENLL